MPPRSTMFTWTAPPTPSLCHRCIWVDLRFMRWVWNYLIFSPSMIDWLSLRYVCWTSFLCFHDYIILISYCHVSYFYFFHFVASLFAFSQSFRCSMMWIAFEHCALLSVMAISKDLSMVYEMDPSSPLAFAEVCSDAPVEFLSLNS